MRNTATRDEVTTSTTPDSITSTDRLALDVLHELVATPSLSGNEMQAVNRFVQHAAQLGFETEVDEAGNGHAIRRSESHDHEVAPHEIALLGHIDTVPGAVPVRLEDGILHGRGSVDAKGPLCAMLFAAARVEVPPDVTVRVIAAVGEETANSPGARYLVDRLHPAACIIGEPSGWDGVTLGYKGRLLARALVDQPNGHSAGPNDTALDYLFAWWQCVREHIGKRNDGQQRAFDCLHGRLCDCSSMNNGLQDVAELTAGFRLPTWIAPAELENDLRNMAGDVIQLSCDGHTPGCQTERNDPVVRAISSAIRMEGAQPRPKLKTGTADFNVVSPAWNCPIAAYGPGDSALDHTPNEHLVIDDYLHAIRVLKHAVTTLAEDTVARVAG